MTTTVAWPRAHESKDEHIRKVVWGGDVHWTGVRRAFVAETKDESPDSATQEDDQHSLPPPSPEPEPIPEPPPPPPAPDPQPEIDKARLLAKELEKQLGVLGSAISEAQKAASEGYFDYRDEVLDLALAVAGELAGGAIEADPERIISVLDEAFELLGRDRVLRVYLNPELYEQTEIAGVLDELKSNPQIKVCSDRNVGDIGMIIESDRGRIDARIQSRLGKLRHALNAEEGDIR